MREHKSLKCNCEYYKWPLKKNYSKKHDAWFCPHCDMWIEKACADETCEYCVGRPDKPSEVVGEN